MPLPRDFGFGGLAATPGFASSRAAVPTALFVGITDGSLDAALERHLANIDPKYGSEIAAEILEREAKWLAAHTWRDRRDEQESAVNANSLENPVRHVQAA